MIVHKFWSAFVAQLNKVANLFWEADPIAQLRYEYDKAVEQLKEGRTGLEQYRGLVEPYEARLGKLIEGGRIAYDFKREGWRDFEQWLVMAYAACFAVLGTTLSRSFLDRLSDRQFYYWTRRLILALGAVYVGQGIWLMVSQ